MKKIIILLAFTCLSFATISFAQTGWYIETTKFDKYIPNSTGTFNIQYRYDKASNKNLIYERKSNNTITISIIDYDAVGNSTHATEFIIHKDIKINDRYIVDQIVDAKYTYDAVGNLTKRSIKKSLDEKEFSEVVQKIMDRLDSK